MDAKIDFRNIFCDAFYACDLTCILGGFFDARNLENHCFSWGRFQISGGGGVCQQTS